MQRIIASPEAISSCTRCTGTTFMRMMEPTSPAELKMIGCGRDAGSGLWNTARDDTPCHEEGLEEDS